MVRKFHNAAPDLGRMERRRRQAAIAETRALRRAESAMGDAEAHLEATPRALVIVFVLGVLVGGIALTGLGALLEVLR